LRVATRKQNSRRRRVWGKPYYSLRRSAHWSGLDLDCMKDDGQQEAGCAKASPGLLGIESQESIHLQGARRPHRLAAAKIARSTI